MFTNIFPILCPYHVISCPSATWQECTLGGLWRIGIRCPGKKVGAFGHWGPGFFGPYLKNMLKISKKHRHLDHVAQMDHGLRAENHTKSVTNNFKNQQCFIIETFNNFYETYFSSKSFKTTFLQKQKIIIMETSGMPAPLRPGRVPARKGLKAGSPAPPEGAAACADAIATSAHWAGWHWPSSGAHLVAKRYGTDLT